ncbi:uncharacterized protein LOC144797658 [Lissotriton helveticus]
MCHIFRSQSKHRVSMALDRAMKIAALLFYVSIFHQAFTYSDCEKNGGSCVDYRQTKCIAGVVQGFCPGFWYDRCCMPCDKTCLDSHNLYKIDDTACGDKNGTCMDNSNYCDGKYVEGQCGGPVARQCCVKE